tara:strand:- start:528 stop:1601 length:1074 start_codon:yes stop_codon:yes gene_type:complete
MNNNSFLKTYKNLKVLITGSTGFKGAWLSFWLNKAGAKVTGVGLNPEKDFILFEELKLKKKISQHIIDIENFKKLNHLVKKIKPDIIFHLAAQSIVSESYINPLKTIKTNTLGSVNILEIVRKNKIKNLVYITSDKCYLNKNLTRGYKEKDTLGGYDNYSSSKASAEILFHSYFESFFKEEKNVFAATARAGNVIGGGDFKKNRIIPDLFKSLYNKQKLILRSPHSTRPWQHVLEPLSGYLNLGHLLLNKKINPKIYPSWNFGPKKENCKQVVKIIDMFYKYIDIKKNYKITKKNNLKEAKLLSLDIKKAEKELFWKPRLSLEECVEYTSDWYLSYLYKKRSLEDLTNYQIEKYLSR